METTTYRLVGITPDHGQCDHCGRDLSRLFRVLNETTGTTMVVGRVCAAKVTGYSWSTTAAQRAERLRLAEESAAATYGALWLEAVALHEEEGRRLGMAGAAGSARIALRNGDIDAETAAQWLEDARTFLARVAA